ncbi:MAG: flagellar hook-associated protein 3 FlgL [Gammaproteobacteria bacterium]|nr:MAG: flagellar hook-associated protein 3 FlgL [Gammaproteobacteria bacterium]TND06706.1 MAG: flagellar hook-associated protein 3 FlgL [Gammaproteobacteria bacterium]
MRVSTAFMHQQAINIILDQQARVNKTQQQISTGKNVLKPSDNPAASADIMSLEEAFARSVQYQDNAERARARLGVEETALADIANTLQRLHELSLQANNATQNDTSRAAIANEVRLVLDGLMDLANLQDPNGEYIFSGFKTQTPAYSRSGGVYTYNGDQGQRFIQIGSTRQVAMSDPGTDVFSRIKSGNGTFSASENPANTGTGIIGPGRVVGATSFPETYTVSFLTATTYEVRDSGAGLVASGNYVGGDSITFAGVEVKITGGPATGDSFTVTNSVNQDIFTTVEKLAAALETKTTSTADKSHVQNSITRELANIERALDNVLDIRSRVGARINAVEDQNNVSEGIKASVQTTLSSIQTLDLSEAVSRLNRQLITLQAAQTSFLRVQQLSLFNSIG